MKLVELGPQDGACFQEGIGNGGNGRVISNEFTDTMVKPGRADDADLESEIAQRAA